MVAGAAATFAGALVVVTEPFVVPGVVTGFAGGFVPAGAAFVAVGFGGGAGWGACAIAETLSTTPNPTPIRRFERDVNTNPSLPKLRTPKQDQSLCADPNLRLDLWLLPAVSGAALVK